VGRRGRVLAVKGVDIGLHCSLSQLPIDSNTGIDSGAEAMHEWLSLAQGQEDDAIAVQYTRKADTRFSAPCSPSMA
jgi:hypothetical protein